YVRPEANTMQQDNRGNGISFIDVQEIPSDDYPEHYFNFASYKKLPARPDVKHKILTVSEANGEGSVQNEQIAHGYYLCPRMVFKNEFLLPVTVSFVLTRSLENLISDLRLELPGNQTSIESAFDDLDVCHSLVDQLSPPVLFSQLRGMDYDQLFAEFNVGAARQTCVSTELSLKEAEVAEEICLRGQIATLESAVGSKDTELAFVNAQVAKLNDDLSSLQLSFGELSAKAATLESQKDSMTDQDEQVKVLSDRVAELDSDLMGMVVHLDEEFYPRFLTTIAGRRWILSRGLKLVVMKCLQSSEYLVALGGAIGRAIDKGMQNGLEAGIDHGWTGKSLADVAAYDPSAEENYVSVVNALRGLDFPLLSQLDSQKNAKLLIS
ncbi:hypothetical protein Tco_0856007, partial [Tanacetum coccineum]